MRLLIHLCKTGSKSNCIASSRSLSTNLQYVFLCYYCWYFYTLVRLWIKSESHITSVTYLTLSGHRAAPVGTTATRSLRSLCGRRCRRIKAPSNTPTAQRSSTRDLNLQRSCRRRGPGWYGVSSNINRGHLCFCIQHQHGSKMQDEVACSHLCVNEQVENNPVTSWYLGVCYLFLVPIWLLTWTCVCVQFRWALDQAATQSVCVSGSGAGEAGPQQEDRGREERSVCLWAHVTLISDQSKCLSFDASLCLLRTESKGVIQGTRCKNAGCKTVGVCSWRRLAVHTYTCYCARCDLHNAKSVGSVITPISISISGGIKATRLDSSPRSRRQGFASKSILIGRIQISWTRQLYRRLEQVQWKSRHPSRNVKRVHFSRWEWALFFCWHPK